jgi:eukaryotic translation initiation factor 2C
MGKKQFSYYPIEVLQVCDNQRVKTNQLTPQMTQQAIRKCAVPPAILRSQMEKVAQSLHLWDSKYLNDANIKVLREPLNLRAHELTHPELETGDGINRPIKESAGWKMNKVYNGQSLVGSQYGWASFCFWPSRGGQGCLAQNEMDDFLSRYQKQSDFRGIRLGNPRRKEIIMMNKMEDMANIYDWASNNDIAFMLCFHGDGGDAEQVHHEIKANERRYFVITQCIRIGTVRNVIAKGQRLTIDNILNKTNVKLGGLNYTLPNSRIAKDMKTLIVGFSSNHPGGGIGTVDDTASNVNKPPSYVGGPPTAVGFAANVGPTRQAYDFIGDFLYQQAQREEKVNVIESIVQRCMSFFRATRNGEFPERVLLFRNGCSEGHYASILKYEVPLLRKALKDEGMAEPKLTLVVCNKLQNVRFFNKNIDSRAKPPDQNLKPGTIIDTSAVHPEFAEFYLNSHRALQGTARTPKYTVVYDDSEHDLDELERLTYDLCFGHQIVPSPISLPAPVLIASEYAKRGRNLYNSLSDELKQRNPDIKYSDLNDEITFYGRDGTGCWISEYRVNA